MTRKERREARELALELLAHFFIQVKFSSFVVEDECPSTEDLGCEQVCNLMWPRLGEWCPCQYFRFQGKDALEELEKLLRRNGWIDDETVQ